MCYFVCVCCFCFKQKTAYEMRISDWSSDVCSSDLSLCDQHHALCSTTQGKAIFTLVSSCEPAQPWSSFHKSPAHVHCRGCARRGRRQDSVAGDCSRDPLQAAVAHHRRHFQIGRASCRERVCQYV